MVSSDEEGLRQESITDCMEMLLRFPGRTLGLTDRGCGRREVVTKTPHLMCLEPRSQTHTRRKQLVRDTVGPPAPEAAAVLSVTLNSLKVTLKARESQSPVTDADYRGHDFNRPRQLPHVDLHNRSSRPNAAQVFRNWVRESRWVAAQKPP